MVDIIHRIGIRAPATQVYEALTTLEGLARWWTDEVRGDARVGGRIEFYFRSETGELRGKVVMEVQALDVASRGPPNGWAPTSPSNYPSRTTRPSSSSAIGTGARQSSSW